ncbi:MAG TPA: TIGR01777 family oxidoreductase [Homoserinimonas sp.]|nr:TIGR01777 family oxidoreductase [Homoserinimonas sp.]
MSGQDSADQHGSTVVIAGASGFIGTELASQLRLGGHRVIRLVRRAAHAPDERSWDPRSGVLDPSIVDEADALVNLSGASLSRLPWTYGYKRTILRSRVDATRTLAQAVLRSTRPPAVFVSGSAVGFYGDRPGEVLTESSPKGEGFLARVVESWEAEAMPAATATRVVCARTSVVVGKGGALKPLMLLARLRLGGPIGGGKQHWPWISLHDEAAALVHLATVSTASGPVNLTGPTPATQGELGSLVAARLGRPYWLPVPAWAIRAALATAGRDLLLVDQMVVPTVLQAEGFQFRHPTVEQAVESMAVGRRPLRILNAGHPSL